MHPLNALSVLLLALSLRAAGAQPPDIQTIFKSTDRGRSWQRVDRGLPGNSRINALGSFGQAVFAGTDAGMFVSHDEGASWQRTSTPTSARVLSIASSEWNLYAGTNTGLFVSADQGRTWEISTALPPEKFRSLFGNGQTIYAGAETSGVYRSGNAGRSWTRLHAGLPAHAQVFAMSMVRSDLFAALYGKGLYTWVNREERWAKTGDVSPLALIAVGTTLIAGHNPGGVFWSDDFGTNWSKASGELPVNAPVWELGAGADFAIAGAAGGIFYSEDRGRTWTRARTGLPVESPGVAFLVKGNTIFASTTLKASDAMPPPRK